MGFAGNPFLADDIEIKAFAELECCRRLRRLPERDTLPACDRWRISIAFQDDLPPVEACLQRNRFPEATTHFDESVRLDPGNR